MPTDRCFETRNFWIFGAHPSKISICEKPSKIIYSSSASWSRAAKPKHEGYPPQGEGSLPSRRFVEQKHQVRSHYPDAQKRPKTSPLHIVLGLELDFTTFYGKAFLLEKMHGRNQIKVGFLARVERLRKECKMDNAHSFTAIRGIQGGREYYVAMVPLKVIPKIFLFEDAELPADLRAQRNLNRARVPDIAQYLIDNPRNYTFSSLTASVDGKVHFAPHAESGANSNLGRLLIPMTARFLINDGQHRRAAIEAALKERPELGEETLSVIFFVDAGLKRSQQMFADLNRHVVRPPQSLALLYDHRDPFAQMICRLVSRVTVFKNLTEMEKASVPSQANKLFTLNGIHQATRILLKLPKKKKVTSEHETLAFEFWQEVARAIPDWHLAAEKKVSCVELRRDYLHAHGVALTALGGLGTALVAHRPAWKMKVQGLRKLDWSRSNGEIWEGRALVGGRVSKAHIHVILTTNLLKKEVGLSLAGAEEQIENNFCRRRTSRNAG